ncbi:MAG: type II secretion system F family protein [Candidatus Diapherotrites archaeon]|nr:type II secretion system F family protein [Candidatus Diapherotrites archaeon]
MIPQFYSSIGRLVPRRVVHRFKKELEYLNIEIPESSFVGFLFLYGFFLSAGLAANMFFFLKINPFPAFVFFYTLFVGGAYMWLNLAADSKGKYVEKILPDALQLVASNVKAGLTTERALLVSAREEFGPLEVELRRAAGKIIGGIPIAEALAGIPKKIKSRLVESTIWLIAEGIQRGGEIGDLLIELADDIREQDSVKQEISANISMYVLLIFFASAFGAPVLFGVSTFIVQILTTQAQSIPAVPAVSVGGGASSLVRGFTGGGEKISFDFVLLFSMVSLFATSVFAAMTIGVINTGSEKGGTKYMPIILLIAFSLFFIVRAALESFFGNLI